MPTDPRVRATRPGPRVRRTGRWACPLALVIAGAALVPVTEWVVHGLSGTTETRAVLVDVTVVERSGRSPSTYDALAVTADGQGIELSAAGAGVALTELPVGSPVVVVRSAADGQIMEVRTPGRTVDVEHHLGAILLVVLGIALCVGAVWFAFLFRPSRTFAALVVLAGLLVSYLAFLPRHDLGPTSAAVPDAMAGYADPPTGPVVSYLDRRVDTVIPMGTAVILEHKHRTTVTGPPVTGPPPGADPQVAADFTVVRVPLLAEPGPDAGAFGIDGGNVPNMILIGAGRGVVTELWRSPTCAGAPDALPAYFTPPRRGFVCFAVPDGFVPRYLVFPNADVAVDLRATAGA